MLAAPVQIESCSYFVWRSVPYQPEGWVGKGQQHRQSVMTFPAPALASSSPLGTKMEKGRSIRVGVEYISRRISFSNKKFSDVKKNSGVLLQLLIQESSKKVVSVLIFTAVDLYALRYTANFSNTLSQPIFISEV